MLYLCDRIGGVGFVGQDIGVEERLVPQGAWARLSSAVSLGLSIYDVEALD